MKRPQHGRVPMSAQLFSGKRKWIHRRALAPLLVGALLLFVVVVVALQWPGSASARRKVEWTHPPTMGVSGGGDATTGDDALQRASGDSALGKDAALSSPPSNLTSPTWLLSPTGNVFLDDLVVSVLSDHRGRARQALFDARLAHAEAMGVAPLRACFVSLIRHTDEGVRRFHRLLANVRQQMPKMAGRYPFVAFHEPVVTSGHIAKRLLTVELDDMEGHRPHGEDVLTHREELRRVQQQEQQPTQAEDAGPSATTNHKEEEGRPADASLFTSVQDETSLAHTVLDKVSDGDDAAWRWLLRTFVFPKTATHPNPILRSERWRKMPHASGVTSGVELVPLPADDFGNIPKHLRPASRWSYPANAYWGVGYRHMCRFFGIRIFFTPFLRENAFDYYLRLDTDSYILGPPLAPKQRRDDDTGHATTASAPPPPLEEQDLFVTMQRRNASYGFSMLHPQTMRQFMQGLLELYDRFQLEENTDKYAGGQHAAVERGRGTIGRSTTSPLHTPLSELPFPRQDGVHYWDNFEIVDLSMFRELAPYEVQEERHLRAAKEAAEGAPRSEDWAPPLPLVNSGVGRSPSAWGIHDFDVLPNPTLVEEARNILPEVVRLVSSMNITNAEWNALLFDGGGGGGGEKRNENRNVKMMPDGDRPLRGQPSVDDFLTLLHRTEETWSDRILRAQVVLRRRYNVHVVRVHNERLRRMRSWFDSIEAEGGFYYYRWGDAEVRTLTLSMFVEARRIAWVASLPYQHYFNFACPMQRHRSGQFRSAQDPCEVEARRGGGDGRKQRGTARMKPAEMSHYNSAFAAKRRSSGGWPAI